MLQRTREFAARLHEDESGPNTVEWILLIVVGLFVLIGIYLFVQYAMDNMSSQAADFDTEKSNTDGKQFSQPGG